MSRSKVHRWRRPGLRAAVLLVAGLPTLLACSATGFGSPTRHAIANLQAATTKIGTTLQIEDAIIALPSDDLSLKGGLAYLEMDAINFANQPDELMSVTADVDMAGSATPSPAAGSASSPASTSSPTQPAAQSLQAASITTVPAATAGGPGTLRITVLLRTLTQPLRQGDTVTIGLTFHNSGTVSGLLVPVQGAEVVGTFLPTAPPPAPSSASATPTPASSAPASVPASAPASAPASTSPASPSAAATS
ncbi:MAG TPA: hypothetical protein VGD55_00145 [Acidothermaceae bacterium]